MISFLVALAVLVIGFFTYGLLTEKVFGPDDRKTPAIEINDGVDCVPDVTGMGLRDALVFLEKSGYEVTWEGHGAISSQVPEPGTVSEEKKIKLTLKEPERKKKDKDEQKSESAS